jgi:hypothetical protein
MSERLLDIDPLTGIKQYIDTDEMTGISTIRTEQDVTGILELNKVHQRQFSNGKDKWGDGYDHRTKVASIPMTIYMDLQKRGILRDPKAFKRWLNDPDNYAFRTRPGTV